MRPGWQDAVGPMDVYVEPAPGGWRWAVRDEYVDYDWVGDPVPTPEQALADGLAHAVALWYPTRDAVEELMEGAPWHAQG